MEQDDTKTSPRPVAYDAEGRPLYASPEDAAKAVPPKQPKPTVVHMARPLEPLEEEMSPELKHKHDVSVESYPKLDLGEQEYVVLCVRRHPIGLLGPAAGLLFLMILTLTVIILLPDIARAFALAEPISGLLLLGTLCLAALLLGGGYMLFWIYNNNTFFLTNQNIIEKTQDTLFASNVKSVSLNDVVDVSYRQVGIMQTMLGYGTVQVGTKDEEVPYVFNFVREPKNQASTIKDAVTGYKSGRGFGGEVDTSGQ